MIGGGGRGGKNDSDGGIGNGKSGDNQKKRKVTLVCTALFLNNNEIRSIKGLSDILTTVMFNP